MIRLGFALLVFGAAMTGSAEPVFKVRQRALATVYVDPGSPPGLRSGDRLRVMAGGVAIAEMEVVHVVMGSAACRVLSANRPVVVGDVAVLVTRQASAAPKPAPAAATAVTPPVAHNAVPAATPPPSPAASAPPPPPAVATRPPASLPGQDRVGGSGHGGGGNGNGSGGNGNGGGLAPTPVSPSVADRAPERPSRRDFRVKYRSASNAYLDGGQPDGLRMGDRLRVATGADTVAELEVIHLAELSASCRIVTEKRPVRVGDTAVKVGGPAMAAAPAPGGAAAVTAAAGAPKASAVPTASPVRRPHGRWATVRGSASVGYMRAWDRTELALGLEQRTARLDLGLYDIGGQPLSFSLRLRSRQDARARALSLRTPKDERNDRLYELAVRYQPRSDRYGIEAGRIGLYRFVGIGYLDGVLARRRMVSHFEMGGFAGRDAEIDGFGAAAPSGTKYGAFVRLLPGGRYATGSYDATLAFVRESAADEVSREYLSLESRFGRGRLSLSERAELDLNRGWRQELAGRSHQLSNVSVSGSLRISASSHAFVSYDGRRNYRYERNRLVAPDVFDDLFYQGLRAGLSLSRPAGIGFTLGGGLRTRSTDTRHPELSLANAYSVNAGLRHASLFGKGLSLGLDGSGFTNGYTDGGVASANFGKHFGHRHYIDVSYGRSLYRVKLTGQDRVTQWRRIMGRFELGRHLYVLADVAYDTGDEVDGVRGFLETGFVF